MRYGTVISQGVSRAMRRYIDTRVLVSSANFCSTPVVHHRQVGSAGIEHRGSVLQNQERRNCSTQIDVFEVLAARRSLVMRCESCQAPAEPCHASRRGECLLPQATHVTHRLARLEKAGLGDDGTEASCMSRPPSLLAAHHVGPDVLKQQQQLLLFVLHPIAHAHLPY